MQDLVPVANRSFASGVSRKARDVSLRDLADTLHLPDEDQSDLRSGATVDVSCLIYVGGEQSELRFSRLPSSLTVSRVALVEAPNGRLEEVPLWSVRFKAVSKGASDEACYRMQGFQAFPDGSETPCTDGAAEERGWTLLEEAAALMKQGDPFAAGETLEGVCEHIPEAAALPPPQKHPGMEVA